jgi:hypothetical protein
MSVHIYVGPKDTVRQGLRIYTCMWGPEAPYAKDPGGFNKIYKVCARSRGHVPLVYAGSGGGPYARPNEFCGRIAALWSHKIKDFFPGQPPGIRI